MYSNDTSSHCLPASLSQLLVAAMKDASCPGQSEDPPAAMRCQEALQSLARQFLHLEVTGDEQRRERAAIDFMNADGVGVVCTAMESYPAHVPMQVRRP